jgi:DNA-binding transcriptional MerR regulator
MSTYTTRQVATYYNKSDATVRNWAVEFAQYLSPTATPQQGKSRFFTVDDLKVISLVAQMKDQGFTFEEIHLSLKSGQRGEAPEVEPQDLQLMSAAEGERKLVLEIDRLQQAVVMLRRELEQAREKVADTEVIRVENATLKTTVEYLKVQLEKAEEKLEKASQEVNQLNRQLGQEYVRGVLDTLREKGDLPKQQENEK